MTRSSTTRAQGRRKALTLTEAELWTLVNALENYRDWALGAAEDSRAADRRAYTLDYDEATHLQTRLEQEARRW